VATPVLYRPEDHFVVAQQLEDLALNGVVPSLQRARVPVNLGGVTSYLEGPRLTKAPQTDWLTMASDYDPLLQRGRFPVPDHVLSALGRACDVYNFPEIVVSHEITKDQSRMLIPYHPVPINVVEPPNHPGAVAMRSWMPVLSVAGPVIAAILASTLSIAARATVEAIRLDPIIWGVVTADGRKPYPGQLCYYVKLAEWVY
jgi:hypothetical protein